MQANIKGLVDRLELSQAKAMIPFYEAISNAVDAIEEHQDGFNNHSIRIRLAASSDIARQAGKGTLVVDGFDVIDDGVASTARTWLRFKKRTRFQRSRLAPSLLRQAFGRYHRTTDNEGYCSPLSTGNGYIEILSYDKLNKDAERRNRTLFDKLGPDKN